MGQLQAPSVPILVGPEPLPCLPSGCTLLSPQQQNPSHSRLTSSSETSTSYSDSLSESNISDTWRSHNNRDTWRSHNRGSGHDRFMGGLRAPIVRAIGVAAIVFSATAGMAAAMPITENIPPCPSCTSSSTPIPRSRRRRPSSVQNPNSRPPMLLVSEVDGSRDASSPSTSPMRKLFSADVATTSLNVSVVEKATREAGVKEREEARELRLWLEGVREDAAKRGISSKTMHLALDGVQPLPKVIEKDRSQPEMKLTADDYLKRVVSEYRVLRGVAAFNENRELLQTITAEYGVPEEILVSIWGVESSYGNFTGGFDIIQALVTLAYDKEQPRRAQYFRGELLEAMQIMDDGHGPSDGSRMRGSWAGAMGQCQFMPSSFRAYAVDFDGDTRADIWTSRPDVFASMANYLCKNGWHVGEPYGQKVKLKAGMDASLLGLKVKKTVREWQARYHVQKEEGEVDLPPDALASVVAPDGPDGVAYLACHNFQVIMRYNPSQLYALSICHLASRLLNAPTPCTL